MNYRKCYDTLIERARFRTLHEYTEWHHIIPCCMGGLDNSDNLVQLTPEEHYVAHQLLVKIYPTELKLASALIMMSVSSKKNKIRNNKAYGWVRKKFGDSISGENNPKAKLTNEQVLEIYMSSDKTANLSVKYGISGQQIIHIKRRKSYKKVLENIIEPPGVHPSCKRIPLSDEKIISIFLDTGSPSYFKERYDVGVSVVRRIKNRQIYKTITRRLENPGQIILYNLSPDAVFEIRNSKKDQNEELIKKYGVNIETLRNIRLAKTRRLVEFFD